MSLGKILFSFQGRIGRGTFWAVWPIIGVLASFVMFVERTISEEPGILLFLLVLLIPLVWIGLSIYVKRWHDLGLSGWMICIGIIPILGLLISIVCLGCIKGTIGPNKYGNDPLQKQAVDQQTPAV